MLEHLIFSLLQKFFWAGTLGFFGIGQGPSPQEQALTNSLANAGNFATSEGERDITAADKFWQAILSGDPGQISQVLGPEISAVNKQAGQKIKTANEFGNRSGGTNASNASTADAARGTIDSMIGKLTGTAASSLGAQGGGLLGTGVGANSSAFKAASTIQSQNASKWNDIFKSAASLAAAPFTGGASAAKATQSGSGNWWDNLSYPGDSSSGSGGSDFAEGTAW